MLFYELTLLSPLYYRTRQDSGASGSNTTDPWIGDLAIDYAINYSLGVTNLYFDYTGTKPNYEEVLSLPYLSSVAYPISEINYTRVYDIATSFISQGYFNYKAFLKTGNAPMRNWLKRQGLSPGNRFCFALAVKDGWYPPEKFTIRLGNMKETLALCSRVRQKAEKISVNLFTLRLLLNKIGGKKENPNENRKNELYETLSNDQTSNIKFIMPQYVIMEKVNPDKWIEILGDYR
jgi:CRISPR-associated protein Csc1